MRPRILFAWEMGANFGHITKIAKVAEELVGKAEISVAVREPAAFRKMLPDLPAQLLPAPYGRSRSLHAGEKSPANFSAMLATEGWDDSDGLAGLIESWRALFDLVRPDLLVCQAAPTALLAAYGVPLRRVVLGSGYDNPPMAHPIPPFDPASAGTLCAQQEAAVLVSANAALSHHGTAPAERMRDILCGDASLLVCWPQLDHYPERPTIQPDHPPYLGPLFSDDRGVEAIWSGRKGRRIFAYLRPGNAVAGTALRALQKIGPENDIIIAAPHIQPDQAAKLKQAAVQVVDGPARLAGLLKDADLGICHSGTGVASAFLAAGVPQIGLPTHREQAMLSRAVARAGAGLGIAGRYDDEVIIKAISDTAHNSALKSRVNDLAKIVSSAESVQPQREAASVLMRMI